MEELEEIVSQISKITAYYMEKSASMSLDHLQRAQDKLATYCWRFAVICADIKISWNACRFSKNVNIDKVKMAMMDKGLSGVQAEASAKTENASKIEEELKMEAVAYKADLLLRQANITIKVIQQRISNLKKELDSTQASSRVQ